MTDKPSARLFGANRRPILFGALAISALLGSSAQAQLINPFTRYSGPTLTREDLDAGAAAIDKLLDDPATIGQTESWTGPRTGNKGKFTLRRVFERSGMPCRVVASEVDYRQPHRRRHFTLTACRAANGQWKLAS